VNSAYKPRTLRHRMKKSGNFPRSEKTRKSPVTMLTAKSAEHTKGSLARSYAWIRVGAEPRGCGKSEIDALNLQLPRVHWRWLLARIRNARHPSGAHSARVSHSSRQLRIWLGDLRASAGELGIPRKGRLLSFRSPHERPHWSCHGRNRSRIWRNTQHVDSSCRRSRTSNAPRGLFGLSFRDYSVPLIEANA